MERTLTAMQTALRVMNALSNRTAPNANDVQELRRLAPLLDDAPIDELARDVIQQCLRRRALIRGRAAGIGD
jgi:hypothetical protein